MKKNIKNSLIAFSVVAGATLVIVPSTISIIKAKQSSNYDLGVATDTITTLNYLKYKSVGYSIQSMVEGLIKAGANKKIIAALGLPKVDLSIINLPGNKPLNQLTESQKASMKESGRFYPISNYGYTTGSLAPKVDDDVSTLIGIMNTSANRFVGLKAILNDGQSMWSNGEPVVAQDFIDSLQYILDFNTASQLVNNVINLRIKNTEKIIAAQEDYIKAFKTTYINPFGRANYIWDQTKKDYIENPDFVPWKSQNPGDEAHVEKIKEAVLGFGAYTGQAFEGYSNEFVNSRALIENSKYKAGENEVISIENPKFDPTKTEKEQPGIKKIIDVKLKRNRFFDWKKQDFDAKTSKLGKHVAFAQNKYQIFFEMEESTPESLSSIIGHLSTDASMLPVNRKFVETVAGGIKEFGSTIEKFLWNGPFDVEDISLGTNGYIILKKRLDYYSHEKTLPNRVKIYFQKNPIVTVAMFEKGYIVESDLPTISQLKTWTNPELKPYMKKTTGYGTIGLQLNLDKRISEERKNYLTDPDLRVALAFAINREEVMKLSGWDASFPVVTWTAFGQAVTTKGFPLESYFDNKFFTTKYDINGKPKKFPIQSYTHHDHQAKQFTFEQVKRVDTGFDIATAKTYLEAFKEKHPNVKKIKMQYLSNSSLEQINAGLALKDQIRKAFNGFIEIELKDLPTNVYDEIKAKGQFDLAYGNFDFFGTSPEGYVKTFFFEDGIKPEDGKQSGYRLNTAGNWSYRTYFDEVVKGEDESFYTRLEIKSKIWNKIKELAYKKESESEADHKDRVGSLFTSNFTETEISEGWNESEVFKTITALEKIIRDSAPVIPLMEVDTKWKISRLGGLSSSSLSLQFAYDISNPPRPTLPRTKGDDD